MNKKLLKSILTLKKIRSQFNQLTMEIAGEKWLSNLSSDIAYTLTIAIQDSCRLMDELNKRDNIETIGFNPRKRNDNEKTN